jgi:hypothetical protein
VQHHELNFGWCLLDGATSPSSTSDALESSCRLLMPSRLLLLVGFLQWCYQGVDLPGPPYGLHCYYQSRILMMTGRLDMLWLSKWLGCDRVYPEQDPNPSPLAY